MRVFDIALTRGPEGWELAGSVSMDRLDVDGLRLWYRFPEEWSIGELDATPFLPSLLATAMWWREPLRIEGPVSARLLTNVEAAMRVYRSLFPDTLSLIEVEADAVPLTTGRPATACLFSCGVDSWYSVLQSLEHPPRDAEPLTHVIYVPEVDFQYSPTTHARFLEDIHAAAARVGLHLIRLDSNLRSFTERFQEWGVTHGSVLAGMASTLNVTTLLIPSPLPYRTALPYGSHPVLDPLWSTERTTVIHHGGETDRVDKIRYLAQSDVALDTLKVCYEVDTRTNCGRCIKCMLTMVGLAAVDALDRCDRFETPLNASRLARQRVKSAGHRALLVDLLPALRGDRTKRRLARAIQLALARDEVTSATRHLGAAFAPSHARSPGSPPD